MIMEYRTWTSIAEMPFGDERRWLAVMEHLEREHEELGPIASWDDETTMVIVLARDEPDEATAARHAAGIVSDALLASRIPDRSVSVIRVEPATDAIAA
jgi:hypothetical protein